MQWLFDRIHGYGESEAIIAGGEVVTYSALRRSINRMIDLLDSCAPGSVVGIAGSDVASISAAMLALAHLRQVAVPLPSSSTEEHRTRNLRVALADYYINVDSSHPRLHEVAYSSAHPLYQKLRSQGHAGLVLFSSGTTGEPKASVLDLTRLTDVHRAQRPSRRTIGFLTLDHIGGINTLLHSVCHGGAVVTPASRTPEDVCAAINEWKVSVLPTTPTFLNMLLLSGVLDRVHMPTLRLVTYGTEPMPPNTLRRLHAALPGVRLKQTYGLSEVGILPTRSKSDNDLWLELGGNGFEHKVVDGILWVKSDTAMLGYLNADAPFDKEGFFCTQDQVEVQEGYVRILGRRSEIINVGGEKVYPGEVEDVLLSAPGVADATVAGSPNPVTGMVVKALVRPAPGEDPDVLRRRLFAHCRQHLLAFKVPALIEISDAPQHSHRFKKTRALA